MIDLDACQILDLPVFDKQGKGLLSVAEGGDVIPFDIKRIYWIYRVPYGEVRGGHSHIKLCQVVVAVTGSFEVVVDNGKGQKRFLLNTPSKGLLIPSGIWCTLKNFSNDAVCLCMASELYDEKDYIRDYNEFLNWTLQNEDRKV